MALFPDRAKIDVLQKQQENIEIAQENTKMLVEAFQNMLYALQSATDHENNECITPEEQWRAAYALNLCTVSVSQIIDYNDVYFLEQEYDAILNNLNLQMMPKDEALLNILKQLLDVITFFRIQEGERKLLHKEYQQKMKDAIWSSVPNLSVIVAGGSPISMAISLAAQVGIGYMNYRKEKAKIGLDQERKEWELERSAMEQFNGLRRELFETAWRLADKYQFDDCLRLTERQITQYNQILMDANNLRRFSRLDYIHESFEAYPPFWYYFGSAAFAAANDYPDLQLDYYQKADKYFNKYLEKTDNQNKLLREDHLVAQCALEYFELLTSLEQISQTQNLNIPDYREKKLNLLNRARESAGNVLDVMQMCAMEYLSIGALDEAAALFSMLANENYNTEVNAQLLSRIYVVQAIQGGDNEKIRDYYALMRRIPNVALFPLPDNWSYTQNQAYHDKLCNDFANQQTEELRMKYASAISQFVSKYEHQFNELWNTDGDITQEMYVLFTQMGKALDSWAELGKTYFSSRLGQILNLHKASLIECFKCYEVRQAGTKFTFKLLTKEIFDFVTLRIRNRIEHLSGIDQIAKEDTKLLRFCQSNNLQYHIRSLKTDTQIVSEDLIAKAIFGKNYSEIQESAVKLAACMQIINDDRYMQNNLIIKWEKYYHFWKKDDPDYIAYINEHQDKLKEFVPIENIIAIVNSTAIDDRLDLLFTTESIFLFDKKKRLVAECLYGKVKIGKKANTIEIGTHPYDGSHLNIKLLLELFNELSKV